jgi:hypothetical protein
LAAAILGGLVGGAIGSLIPGVGTAAGFAGGVGAGVAAWGINWLLNAIGKNLPGTALYTEERVKEQQQAQQWFAEQKTKALPGEPIIKGTTIGPIKHAFGGILTSPHLGLVAEAGPEAIIPLLPGKRGRALELYQQVGRELGIKQYAAGGIAGAVTGGNENIDISASIKFPDIGISDWLNTNIYKPMQSTIDRVKSWGQTLIENIVGGMELSSINLSAEVTKLTMLVETKFKQGLGIASPSKVAFDIGRNTMLGLVNGMDNVDVQNYIKKRMDTLVGSMGEVKSNVNGWLTAALNITRTPLSWLPGLQKLVGAESGGNPGAINPIAVGREHATGLLQTLPSTFRAYAVKGMENILNPVHNAAAAISYIKSRYGSVYDTPLFKSSGKYVGYAQGGIVTDPHLGLVAEAGPEGIIPLSARERTRALGIWEQIGVIIGAMPKMPESAGIGAITPVLGDMPEIPRLADGAAINPILGMLPKIPGSDGVAFIDSALGTVPNMPSLAGIATVNPRLGVMPGIPELAGRAIYQAETFAAGGIFTKPQVGRIAEASSEAIVPLADGMRTRATELWQEVGMRLGVMPELPMPGGTAKYRQKMISAPALPSLMGEAYYQTAQGAMPEIPEIKSQATYDVALGGLPELSAMRGQAIYDTAISTLPMLPEPEKQATYQAILTGILALPALSGQAEYQVALEQLSNLPELYSRATYSVALGGVPNPLAMREMASYQARIEMLPELPELTGFGGYQMGIDPLPELPPLVGGGSYQIGLETLQRLSPLIMGAGSYQAELRSLPKLPKLTGLGNYQARLDSQPALSPLAGLGTYQANIGPLSELPGLPGAARYSTMPFSQTALPELTGMAQYQTNLEPGPILPELRGAARYVPTMDTLPAMATGGLVDYPVLAGEAGPEAVIPLSATYRSRALDLWLETGEDLGVEGYREGGFISHRPTAAFGKSTEVNIDLGGINIGPISATDLAAVEEKVHEEVRSAFRQVISSLQNRA